ncbi:MAG: hypothetical protein WD847_03825 [Pirellulales bacterium]
MPLSKRSFIKCSAALVALFALLSGGQRECTAQPPRGRQPAELVPAGPQPRREGPTRPAAGPARPGVRSPQLDLPEPFRLTPQEQATLDLVLRAWEERSGRIKTLKCSFTLREYDLVFRNVDEGQSLAPKRQSEGRLSYIAPDKGEYEIPDEEHWICDGKSIFEFSFDKRQLVERPLPPEMQGKAITNGPLPFVFGTTADALHRRYSMRVIPDRELPEQHEGQVWLEARPRFRQDAANFRSVTAILDDRKLLPVAVEQVLPNGNRTSYVFRNVSVNNPLDVLGGLFKEPRAPRGWQRVIERPPLDESQLADPPAQPRQQAGRRRVPLR